MSMSMNEDHQSDQMTMRPAIETDGVRIVDVGVDPTPERMNALDVEARELGGVRRIAPSIYVLYPKKRASV